MKTCLHEIPKPKEKPIDHDKYPIIVHIPNGCLIWDKEKQDWKIKIKGKYLSEAEKSKAICVFSCWCGASFWIKTDLNPYEEKEKEMRLISFQKKHERCGFKKDTHTILISNFLIKEEGELK
jgi:hypothetical protein